MIAVTAAAAPVVSLAPSAHAAPSTTPQLPQQPMLPAAPTTPRILPTPAPTSTVTMTVDTSKGVNVRSGPSTSYRVVGGYRDGARLTGTLTSNNWLKIGNNRFVAAWNLTRGDGGGGGGGGAERVTQWMEASVGNVRSGPGLGHSVVTTMRRGTKVTGTWTGNGWLNIGGGKYISGTILTGSNPGGGGGGEQPDPSPTEVTRWVSATVANVRSGPSTSYSVVGSKTAGTRVTGTMTSNGWLKLSGSQFMAGSVLTADEPGGGGAPEPAPSPAPSPTRQLIINTAAKYLGTPYKWGGNSPEEGFDCSGYTTYVFAEVGITLPRTAATQQAATTPTSNPQPGDLVFHGSPAYHVGIYAGDGMMYDTGRPGVPTQLRKIFPGVSGYGKVDGVG
ncbi:C40 family peptidase [Serinicoccus kebangsaanensis]|uniref:C40 family peptidase n=1 Tax=Serinicoccus kebangsaanensis TaxID=2602069 RepID=UPI002674E9B8|nr:NlpC/P60 family protein [Serinicoccus kebangsaanensis]